MHDDNGTCCVLLLGGRRTSEKDLKFFSAQTHILPIALVLDDRWTVRGAPVIIMRLPTSPLIQIGSLQSLAPPPLSLSLSLCLSLFPLSMLTLNLVTCVQPCLLDALDCTYCALVFGFSFIFVPQGCLCVNHSSLSNSARLTSFAFWIIFITFES